VNQQEFRHNLSQLVIDELDELGYPGLADAVYGTWEPNESVAIDKAMNEAYNSLQVALRKLSRLGARLDYLEREDPK
jgi:hypothetical protein